MSAASIGRNNTISCAGWGSDEKLIQDPDQMRARMIEIERHSVTAGLTP